MGASNYNILRISGAQMVHAMLYSGFPVSTENLYNICTMLNQRRRRWADVVQKLYKCFMFAGLAETCVTKSRFPVKHRVYSQSRLQPFSS